MGHREPNQVTYVARGLYPYKQSSLFRERAAERDSLPEQKVKHHTLVVTIVSLDREVVPVL